MPGLIMGSSAPLDALPVNGGSQVGEREKNRAGCVLWTQASGEFVEQRGDKVVLPCSVYTAGLGGECARENRDQKQSGWKLIEGGGSAVADG